MKKKNLKFLVDKIKVLNSKTNNAKFVVSPFFLVFGLICFLGGNLNIFLIYTFSALFHEIAHLFVAKKRGYKFSQIRLMPYGAELFGETDEFLYSDEIAVAFAGPIFNFSISVLCVALWWLFPNSYILTDDICVANFLMGIFNLIPIFPLDGGRIVLCFLSKKMERKKAVKCMKICTQIFSFILFGLFILSIFWGINLSLGFVAIMLYISATCNKNKASYERVIGLMKRRSMLERGIAEQKIYISENITLGKVFRKLSSQKFCEFVVVDSTFKKIFYFDEVWLEKVAIQNSSKTPIKKFIYYNINNKSVDKNNLLC